MADEIWPLTDRIREYLSSQDDGTQRTLHHLHPMVLLAEALVEIEGHSAALREARKAGRREGIEEAARRVDASADELRNAADRWDVKCAGRDAERISAGYRAREQHGRFLATALRALAEEGRDV